jgi:hypothetical protein
MLHNKQDSKEKENGKTSASVTGENKLSATIPDNRPSSTVQNKLIQTMTGHTPGNSSVQERSKHSGLPDNLRTGIEHLSGISMDDVNVHYNSAQPAQLNAHAYAQGTDIHLAPGQEKHLPHEAWHVVQQKQGRVKPTMQMKGKVKINDDAGLEKEADVMGAKVQMHARTFSKSAPLQLARKLSKFTNGRTTLASVGSSRHIGSLYAQNLTSRFNRGRRIRLEHKGGPKVSGISSYRRYISEDEYKEIKAQKKRKEISKSQRNKLLAERSTLLPPFQEAPENTRLIETKHLNGPAVHRSRGQLKKIGMALNNAQVRALFEIASASDDARKPNATKSEKEEHAKLHNRKMRDLLLSDLFTGHRLQTEAQERENAERTT